MNQMIMNMALNMVQNNPKIAGNTIAKEFINILKTGDEQRGIEMAQNLCRTNNSTPEQAIADARRFFGF